MTARDLETLMQGRGTNDLGLGAGFDPMENWEADPNAPGVTFAFADGSDDGGRDAEPAELIVGGDRDMGLGVGFDPMESFDVPLFDDGGLVFG